MQNINFKIAVVFIILIAGSCSVIVIKNNKEPKVDINFETKMDSVSVKSTNTTDF